MTNSVIGFLIILGAWLIINTVLMTVMKDGKGIEVWGEIKCVPNPTMTGGGTVNTTGGGTVSTATTTAGACKYTYTPFTGIEETSPQPVWANTDPALQSCAAKELGGGVTSAYRSNEYQAHLYAMWNTWCNLGLSSDTSEACASVKSSVNAEISKHGLSCSYVVAQSASKHTTGTAVDISGGGPKVSTACFAWFGTSDIVHYTLKTACYGDCNATN